LESVSRTSRQVPGLKIGALDSSLCQPQRQTLTRHPTPLPRQRCLPCQANLPRSFTEVHHPCGRHCGSPSPCSSFGRTASRLPAASIARRRSKVSETIFPRSYSAIGRIIVENRGPKCRIRPTSVSHHNGPAVPPSGAPAPIQSRP
jgi:hypothetical protein